MSIFATPWTAVHQASLSITNSWNLLKLMSISSMRPSKYFIPLLSPSSPDFNLFQHQGLLQWISSLHQVTKLLEFQFQYQSLPLIFRTDSLWDGLVGSPCSPMNSQESSPTPQFKRINSVALSFLYSVTLTSVQYYWKNHSFD